MVANQSQTHDILLTLCNFQDVKCSHSRQSTTLVQNPLGMKHKAGKEVNSVLPLRQPLQDSLGMRKPSSHLSCLGGKEKTLKATLK